MFREKISLSIRMEIQDLVNFAKECQGISNWDNATLIRVGGQLAVKVNSIQNLSGQEKQKIICQVLKQVLDDVEKKEKAEEGKSEEEKKTITEQFAQLKKAVDDIIPASLELAIAAARGKLDLRKVKMSVWVRYFSCCSRSVVTALASANVISQSQAKQASDAVAAVEVKASEAAAAADAAVDQFEQKNPMIVEKSEDASQVSKPEETVKTE